MKKHSARKLLSLALVVCMLLSLAAPAAAAPSRSVTFTQVNNSAVSASLLTRVDEDLNGMCDYVDTDVVRVSIFLEDEATLSAGFSAENIAANSQAMAYRADLKDRQAAVTAAIERKLGAELDVVWNLTLAANVISANVPFGKIDAIEQVAGVSQVLIETLYEPDVVKREDKIDPSMATSSAQIGSGAAWAAGYTGAGSRIAIIDTGSDTDHQSLDASAFEYSLAYWAGKSGLSLEEYLEQIDLLDAAEIEALSSELNAPVGAEAYVNAKIPYGYNYVDGDLDITHDNDSQGSHGSHVAGIATANAYVPVEDGFVNAMESSLVRGVAPDAQLITMKVFGKQGGAYDSDYMAAIEDAIVLGCDSANLSLGSGSPGTSRCATAAYQAILENLSKTGIVVAMSAGNSGYWAENAYNAGYLYAEDVSMQTDGIPGSYTNSLAVASVDNDGTTGFYISVDGMMIVYNEMLEGNSGPYSNKPFTTIAGDHEYVLIDGVGTAEDWAAVGEALVGKIAICSRGETSFFEKAQLAVEAGAIATFICNNTAGIINMDLTDYPYTQPCASLTQADGLAIKAASTPVADENGNVLYYTGTMTVSSSMGFGQFGSDYYTMSSFSSWGVPGSLELKPEITAPGGLIYSINGVDPSGSAYEVMSGTSMASPQVAGMAALVAQYIRENNLTEQTGLSERQLAQSLLMSTAVPMAASASAYYPVIQQGAGLANVGAATSADSYITMADGSNAGAADGKVKVELGDDPAREGVYSATFIINNLEDVEKTFDLSADFFIQAPTSDGVNMYMYTSTAMIGADVSWTVDGIAIEPAADLSGMDFNGDGIVNSDDGQAILDYATGAVDTLTNMGKADLDADGDVDSYDAYLFLSQLSSGAATVPAGGSATVTVTATLSDMWKATIDYYYPNGTYIQGYIFAESLTDAEGVAGTSHSIPVLGYFGSWSEPSMFDVGSYQTYATGEESRIPYLGDPESNSYMVTYANEPGVKYYFGGNPLVPDAVYMPERNAINSADIISGVGFTAIRNASASSFTAVNETTGEVLAYGEPGAVTSAYYYVNGGYWNNTGYSLNIQVVPTGSEGDVLSMGLTLAPEYYVDAEGNVSWDALADGATFGTTMVIDNTAPELKDVSISLTGNTMTVTASDNEYVAAVALYNKNGTKVLTYAGAKADIDKGETASYVMDLANVNGNKFLLQVSDYALNTTTYVIEMQIGEEPELPGMIAFDLDYNYWATFTKESTYEEVLEYASSDLTFFAATIADHYVFAATDTGDLYVMPEEDLNERTFITNLGFIATDMAFNKADGGLYAVASNYLVEIDKLTGEWSIIDEIGVATNTLACDAEGNFYCNGFSTGVVYTFTLDTIANPEVLVEDVGIESLYVQSMECNPNTGMICWTSYSLGLMEFMGQYFEVPFAYYYEIDPATGEFTQYEDLWDELACLIIPDKSNGASWSAPTEDIASLTVAPAALSLIKGGSAEVTATILPWTVTDRSVTWTSSDESVATVDENGVVTAVGIGQAVITATSNLDSSFTAESTVTVNTLDYTLTGILQDAEGNPMFFDWNLATDDSWNAGIALDTSLAAATYDAEGGYLYVQDGNGSGLMHKVDPATGETVAYGPACGFGAAMFDLADMEVFGAFADPEAPAAMGIFNAYVMIPTDPMLNTFNQGWNLASYLGAYTGGSKFVAITSMGEYVDETGVTNELIFALDDAGTVWALFYDGSTSIGFDFIPSDLSLSFPMNGDNQFCSLIDANDGSLFLSYFTGETNEIYHLVPTADGSAFTSTRVGDVGADVWPAALLSANTNAETAPEWNIAPSMTVEAAPIDERISAGMNVAASVTAEAKNVKASLELNSNSSIAADEKTVTVDITASELTTNGVFEVTYDTAALKLVDAASTVAYTSSVEAEGSYTFGYVSLEGIEADEVIATLTFQVLDTEMTSITVNHKQVNNAAGSTEVIAVEYAHTNTEVRDAIAATCTTAGYTGDTYCTDCGKLIVKGQIIEALGHSYEAVVTEPTCTEAGYTTYTCSVCGDSYVANHVDPDCASAAFTDVNVEKWYHEAVDYVVENGIMNGISDSKFDPNGEMTRAQMVTVLYRLAGKPEVTEAAPFTDVAAGSYYADAAAWANANGITKGVSADKFNPTGKVTREQMVTFLARYAALSGADMTVSGDLSAFTDAADVSGWAVDSMIWAVENGLISGVTSTTLEPDSATTRAQVATVLMRYTK